ncbi:uncharacterized protein [Argopecten irradians]|uniref:uncharacterized protein n=1 Tax=Argopecten irradians TaxID=31199 RepID=UPI00371650A2
MSSLRPCLEFCCSPNTVSKFIRIFPKAAAFFFILHVTIIIYSSMNTSKKDDSLAAVIGNNYIPKDPQHRRDIQDLELNMRNLSTHRNKTKRLHYDFGNPKDKDNMYRVNLP